MIKKIIIILFIFLCIGCSKENKNNDGLSIVTTIYPYYDFSRNIIGIEDTITLLLSPGSELHSYEPTPKDIVKINNWYDVYVKYQELDYRYIYNFTNIDNRLIINNVSIEG